MSKSTASKDEKISALENFEFCDGGVSTKSIEFGMIRGLHDDDDDDQQQSPAANLKKKGVGKLRNLVDTHTKRARIMKAMGGSGWVGSRVDKTCLEKFLVKINPSDIKSCLAVFQLTLHLLNTLVVPYRLLVANETSDYEWLVIEYFLDAVQFLLFLFNFFVPFERSGEVIYSFKNTSVRYLHDGFAVDCLTAFPGSYFSWNLFNGNPLWRIAKLQPFCIFRYYKICSRSSLLLRYVTPYFWIVFLNCYSSLTVVHGCSCFWYFLLESEKDNPKAYGAFATYVPDEDLFLSSSKFQLYLKGVEWSTKHLMGYGVLSTLPHTDEQVAFMLFVAMIGICLYTYLLASVSSFVSHVANSSTADRLRIKLDDVTTALAKLGIPQDVAQEIKGYYIHVYKVASSVTVDGALNDAPPDLLSRVNHEVSRGIIAKIPLFCEFKSPKLIEALVAALTPKVFLPNLRIVSAGDRGSEMLFIWSGEVEVIDLNGETIKVLRNGDSYGELALLMQVRRISSLVTLSYCTIFVLTRQAFNRAVQQFPELQNVIKMTQQKELRRAKSSLSDCRHRHFESKKSMYTVNTIGSSTGSSSILSEASLFEVDNQNEFLADVPGEAAVGAFLFEAPPRATSLESRSSIVSKSSCYSRNSSHLSNSMQSSKTVRFPSADLSPCARRITRIPQMSSRKTNVVPDFESSDDNLDSAMLEDLS